MTSSTRLFFEQMLRFFPSAREGYYSTCDNQGNILETIALEDVFAPLIVDELQKEDNPEFLKKIFDCLEKTLNDGDAHVQDIISITLLEILGNDKATLNRARKYMGAKTYQVQIEADRTLGRL